MRRRATPSGRQRIDTSKRGAARLVGSAGERRAVAIASEDLVANACGFPQVRVSLRFGSDGWTSRIVGRIGSILDMAKGLTRAVFAFIYLASKANVGQDGIRTSG
jgi:hypothetical protein